MLALVGSGEYLPAMEPVDRDLLSRLKGPPRVVCLPTAAGKEGPERIAYWSRLGIDHFTRLKVQVESLPVIDHASANDETLASTIDRANFVYLSGGKPHHLYSTLKSSLAWEAIRSVLSRGGLLAGCSAGAMILGEKFFGFPGLRPGFNFLSRVTVIPHYDEFPGYVITSIRVMAGKDLIVLGIEGNTALFSNGEHYEVLGTGGVIVWKKGGKTRYIRGPLPPDALIT
jgi:cyanophycinase